MHKGRASAVRSGFQVQRSKLKIEYNPYLNLETGTLNAEPIHFLADRLIIRYVIE
jgi:hypothetical protein